MGMPEVSEKRSHGEPTFWVKRRMFATCASPHSHHGAGRPAVWVKAPLGAQAIMVAASPKRYFVPPYVGVSGWVGMWLDRRVSWVAVADVLLQGWKEVGSVKAVAARRARTRTR